MGKQPGTQPPKGASWTAGEQLWSTLQKGLWHAVDKIKFEEMKPAQLSHGLQHLCRISLPCPVRHVAHNSLTNHFVVLDSQSQLHLLKEDGAHVRSQSAPAPMEGLLYATQINQFVGWAKGMLHVMDSSFQLLSQVPSAVSMQCGLYSEYLNRIVTAGEGNLTIWNFRYGFRSLQCRVSVREGLGAGDVFRHLVLDANSTDPHRCFAACDTGAAVFDLSRGKLMAFRKELHSRAITGITYCEATGCAVTASRDTTIKVWDKNWNIQTVFIGHTAPVMAVTIYPQRPLIFSASQDGTIRTWNLDTVDEVDQVHVSEPVEALETKTASRLISISGSSLNLWNINKLYSLFTPLGYAISRLTCVSLRKEMEAFPVRVVCVCQDSTVRLVDVQSGLVVSVLSLEENLSVVDLVYCLPRETLFVLLRDGSLLRANSAKDPMVVKKRVGSETWASKPRCLLLYSHMVDPQAAHSSWVQVLENKGDRKQWQKLPVRMQEKNRYVLILGHENGVLSVPEWFTGRSLYQVEAHSPKHVTALAEYPTLTAVVSAGGDCTVKVWRLFPYVEECLVPILSFSCDSPALHMCALEETLAVAFQDPETVTYSIVQYNLMEQTRREHGPEDDAQDVITSLCCCPHLKLFASSSREGSVKVWDLQNKLLRHLKLNAVPESLAFANQRGDLLVGVERHLFVIPHHKYLPSHFKMQLLCAKFLEPLEGIPLPISDAAFEALVKENARRLKQDPPAEEIESPLLGSRRMALQESKVIRGIQAKKEGLSNLEERDKDLELLQKGKINVPKKSRLTKEMKEEAFEKYLRIFYKKQPKIEIPVEDTFDADEILETLQRVGSISELYGPYGYNMFLGAFSKPPCLEIGPRGLEPLQDAGPPVPTIEVASTVTPVPPPPAGKAEDEQVGGAMGPPAEEAKEPATEEKQEGSPGLSPPEQEKMIETYFVLSSPGTEPSPPSKVSSPGTEPTPGKVKILQLEEDKGRAKDSEKALQISPTSQASLSSTSTPDISKSKKSVVFKESVSLTEAQGSQKLLSSISRVRSQTSSVIIKGFFPERPPTSQEQLRAQVEPEQEGVPLPRIPSGFIPNSVVAQQFYRLELQAEEREERLMRVVGPQELLPGPLRTASPEDTKVEETTSRAGSFSSLLSKKSLPGVFLTQLDESHYQEREPEVPYFVLPFLEMEWFKALFPEGFPHGMTLSEFLVRLLASLNTTDYTMRLEILATIMSLKDKMGGVMKDLVHDSLIEALNKKKDPLCIQEKKAGKFILAALHVLLKLKKDSKSLMVELMTYYLIAPTHIRVLIKDMIRQAGVADLNNYFFKELDSLPAQKGDPKETVRGICSQWLDEKMKQLEEHRERILKWQLSVKQLQEMSSASKEHKGAPERKPSVESYRKDSPVAESTGRDLELPPGVLPGRSSAQKQVDAGVDHEGEPERTDFYETEPESEGGLTEMEEEEEAAEPWMLPTRPIDAIQFFFEKQLEKALEEEEERLVPSAPEIHNTVIALPPIRKKRAILRLGETNAMMRKRKRDHDCFYFPFAFPRYVMKGFAPFVKLPLPRITLEPFPPLLPLPPSKRPGSPTNLAGRKYFIPRLAHADNYP